MNMSLDGYDKIVELYQQDADIESLHRDVTRVWRAKHILQQHRVSYVLQTLKERINQKFNYTKPYLKGALSIKQDTQ